MRTLIVILSILAYLACGVTVAALAVRWGREGDFPDGLLVLTVLLWPLVILAVTITYPTDVMGDFLSAILPWSARLIRRHPLARTSRKERP